MMMACAVGTRAPVARLPRASAIGRRARVGVRSSAAPKPGPKNQKARDATKLSAVMAPETNVSAEELAAEARRRGMGRRFADERSLDNPGELKGIRNFWYPVHFWSKLTKGDASPDFPLFGEEWTLVRTDAAGVAAARASIAFPGCDEMAAIADGGWVCRSVADPAVHLPIGVKDGLVMVWPGSCKPDVRLPGTFKPPEGYTTHAELIIEDVPVEHGLLMENLLDLAHAPFTHTGTFAKGWGVPNFVEFVTARLRKPGDGWHDVANGLNLAALGGQSGAWNPYPIDMKFVVPCMVDSHIGMSQAGAAGGGAQFEEGVQCAECENHLHQLHVCVPSTPGRTRLLYRMSLDFAGWAKWVPGIELVWTEMANQVLGEDLRLVTGQQDRMRRGGRVWAHPVAYDKLGLVYRRWRNFSVGDSCEL
uniref:Pheophorbide a oxygenase domain-containing protein n=1 Tax=Micromonas pusilla TaxID=38833 RepID=A0A7S0IH70_MICPS|mmetsp:Transcript_6281/g.26010  ORF Transcript_6281/g.26010 Transcript_6281/m.26010 type:complete len:420 (+) Transcript_6281:222-1481(+)